MDWLEEKIEQIQVFLQEKSLLKALVCYLCIGMLGVGTMYWITRNICLAWIEVITKRYKDSTVILHSVGIWNWYDINSEEKLLLKIINFFYYYCLYIYTIICFCMVGKLFLEKKIKPAILAIAQALNYINMGDYSHEINWRSKDEIGILCKKVEEMRKALLKNKKDQWKQQEEQRKINAAFAHDIRTPLTVIRGYTEFLQKYVPQDKVTKEMLLEKLNTIHEQEERLLQFAKTMTTIQNIEKWELIGTWCYVSEVIGKLEIVIQGMEQNTKKKINLHIDLLEQKVFLDINLLLEVFENLLSNALRYAKNYILVKVMLNGKDFTIFVKDDGDGFSEKALRGGMEVYFTEEENSREHFGIGLSICKMLCENHGGTLTLQNSIEQGAITAATFVVGLWEG